MNRGRSSDSLANSDADIICSSSGSSPTDFTSDDEVTTENIYMMSGRPTVDKTRSRPATKSQIYQSKIEPHTLSSPAREDYLLQSSYIYQSPGRSILSSNNQHIYKDDFGQNASTSYYDHDQQSSHSRMPDMVPNIELDNLEPSMALTPEQSFANRFNSQPDNVNRYNLSSRGRSMIADPNEGIDHENDENLGGRLNEDDLGPELFNPNAISIERTTNRLANLPGTSRGINTIAARMCSRLVECRSLIDCIEFVEDNRRIIDNVTRIITHEAPAFRNYDFSNYQIDYSVKDSFNPNFWIDREPIVTTADGNCQYHAVSLSLTGTEAYTPEVRLATAVAVLDNRDWFDSMLKLIDRGSILDLVRTISRNYSWGDETTLKAIAVAINRRIFLYTCNIGKKDYEMVKLLSKEELLDAFRESKYRGGTGIHTYADPLVHVAPNNYIMLFHKSEHFIAVLPSTQQPTMFEPYNPIVPTLE